MDNPIDIGHAALEAAKETHGAPSRRSGAEPARRKLEVIFYGMACFDPLGEGRGYRVLFPNGLSAAHGVPAHSAGIWVRGRDQLATARWSWLALRNDFFLTDKRKLTISGVTPTPLDATGLKDRLTALEDCDPNFKISANPDAVIDMTVDHGTLSVHTANSQGMLVVRWLIEAEVSTTVRFTFGDQFVDVPPGAKQIFLANAGASSGMGEHDTHFRLYRRLSDDPAKDLQHQSPHTASSSSSAIPLDDPTFGYISILTPEIVCSPVMSRSS